MAQTDNIDQHKETGEKKKTKNSSRLCYSRNAMEQKYPAKISVRFHDSSYRRHIRKKVCMHIYFWLEDHFLGFCYSQILDWTKFPMKMHRIAGSTFCVVWIEIVPVSFVWRDRNANKPPDESTAAAREWDSVQMKPIEQGNIYICMDMEIKEYKAERGRASGRERKKRTERLGGTYEGFRVFFSHVCFVYV